jgi:hypothetical protein
MLPNLCAKTRVQFSDDVVLPVFSCVVRHPRHLPEDDWKLVDRILVDIHSIKVLNYHDEWGFIKHHGTVVGAKLGSDLDENAKAYLDDIRDDIRDDLEDTSGGESKRGAPPASGSTLPESAERTSSKSPACCLEGEMKKMSL